MASFHRGQATRSAAPDLQVPYGHCCNTDGKTKGLIGKAHHEIAVEYIALNVTVNCKFSRTDYCATPLSVRKIKKLTYLHYYI
jgi:hypothetical protein